MSLYDYAIDTLATADLIVPKKPGSIVNRGIKKTIAPKPLWDIPASYDEMHPSKYVIDGNGNALVRAYAWL